SIAAAADHHAAARLRLNRLFFLKAGNTTKQIIDHLVPDLNHPTVNVTFFHYFTIQIPWMNIAEFDFPRTRFSVSNDGLVWNSAGGRVGVALEFAVSTSDGKSTSAL
ncbi:hypothetical protein PENTCL1PPCAC_4123, partial [Pristionchus entomophagus]